jgi:hypothetical protein
MTTPTEGSFEHINRIEEMRNRLAAGETTFTLDELKLALAWADHLNYFRSLDMPRLTALEAENAALKAEVAGLRNALQFYADPDNWLDLYDGGPSLCFDTEAALYDRPAPVRDDEGSIARAALSTSQGEQGNG